LLVDLAADVHVTYKPWRAVSHAVWITIGQSPDPRRLAHTVPSPLRRLAGEGRAGRGAGRPRSQGLATVSDRPLLASAQQDQDSPNYAGHDDCRRTENCRDHRVPQPRRSILLDQWLELLQACRMQERPDFIHLGVQ